MPTVAVIALALIAASLLMLASCAVVSHRQKPVIRWIDQ